MKAALILGGIIATIALVAFSIFVISPPKPIIVIHGEKLTSIGPLDILNTLFTAWVLIALLLTISILTVRNAALVPIGFYNFF